MQSGVVVPGLVPGIHVFEWRGKGVDGRVKPGHDDQSEADNASPQPRYFPRTALQSVANTCNALLRQIEALTNGKKYAKPLATEAANSRRCARAVRVWKWWKAWQC
jgi:hypothetical protein